MKQIEAGAGVNFPIEKRPPKRLDPTPILSGSICITGLLASPRTAVRPGSRFLCSTNLRKSSLSGAMSTLHEKLFSELGDLLENRIPRSVADRIEEDVDLLDAHDLDTQSYRFLVSLREDYLPDLELWSDQIPRLGPNRYRLLPMGRTQALEAIVKTGGSLVTEISANRIVDYMSRNDNAATALPQKRGRRSSDVQVEPALLSLVCSGLNAKRIAAKRKSA